MEKKERKKDLIFCMRGWKEWNNYSRVEGYYFSRLADFAGCGTVSPRITSLWKFGNLCESWNKGDEMSEFNEETTMKAKIECMRIEGWMEGRKRNERDTT